MSRSPKSPPQPPSERFPRDEMSTGETSSMLRRAHQMTGAPDRAAPAKPVTGAQPALERPAAPAPSAETERLQSRIRALSLNDSALGRTGGLKPARPARAPASAAEDTFVKSKMKQAEKNVPDFDLDEDLG
jgi:hypothetical protein